VITALTQVIAAAATQQGTGPASLDPAELLTYFLQFGPLGIVTICLLSRKFLVPEWVLKQAEKAGEQERATLEQRLSETQEQLEKLQDVFQEQMIPALTRATEVNARYTEEMQRQRYNRDPRDPPPEPMR
jgi:hypothetical protein